MKIEDTRLSAPWERATFGSSLVLFLKHRFQSQGQRTNSPRGQRISCVIVTVIGPVVLKTFLIAQSVTFMIQYVGGIHARLQMSPLRGVERLRLRRNERVSPEVCCYACAGHDVFRVWTNQWIPDGWIEARWIECVRRASVCCVRIIRVFHGPMYVRHAEVREPWIVSGCPVYARKAELNWNHSPGA